MLKISFKFAAILVLSLFLSIQLQAQQARVNPFSINQSNIISELKTLKASNPQMTTEDFVKSANTLLDKKGLNFVVGLDANTCQKIDELKKSRKDPNQPLNLRSTFKAPIGEPATLSMPEPVFTKNECFPCSITLPLLEATDRDFIILVQERNLKFFLPANFLINEAFLVDEKDQTIVKKKWKIPFRTVPLSISDDGNILFVGFEETGLADLALAIFSEGAFQFYAKSDFDETIKREILQNSQIKVNTPNFAYVKFQSANSTQIIKFPSKCPD